MRSMGNREPLIPLAIGLDNMRRRHTHKRMHAAYRNRGRLTDIRKSFYSLEEAVELIDVEGFGHDFSSLRHWDTTKCGHRHWEQA